jgi:hypothetical protein
MIIQAKYSMMPIIIILLSPNNLTTIGVNREGKNMAITWETATSAVLIGGLVSAFLGPELATLGKDWFDTAFVGSFLLLSICFIVAFLLL